MGKKVKVEQTPLASDDITDLRLKFDGLQGEFSMLRESLVSKEALVEQFAKHNKAINELFAKYDKDVRAYITDQIVQGVTEGLKQYDMAAKQNFVTRGDLAAAGTQDITRGSPIQGQGGERGFLDVVGQLVMNAISNGGGGGQSPGDPFSIEFAKYRGLFQRRMELEWSAFLKSRFGALPEAVDEATGHVEVSG